MNIKVSVSCSARTDHPRITIQCPACGHAGTLDTIIPHDVYDSIARIWYGQRKCPNPACVIHIFYIQTSDGLVFTYPPRNIAFDKNNIPENVLMAFEEAIICHSNNCFIASAIMIRKTLEEVCENRGAEGGNLKKRLQALAKLIVVPQELISGMDELRLLGNDAAHIESQTFTEVGKEEIEVSIEFTKEILKAVYQYENLLSKLRGLKKKDK